MRQGSGIVSYEDQIEENIQLGMNFEQVEKEAKDMRSRKQGFLLTASIKPGLHGSFFL